MNFNVKARDRFSAHDCITEYLHPITALNLSEKEPMMRAEKKAGMCLEAAM